MENLQQWFANIETGQIITIAWQVVGAILIFIIGRWIAKAVVGLANKAMTRRKLDAMLVAFLGTILYSALLLCVILASISYLGIAITPLIAILGGAALAIGLALQNSLSNFAAGVMLVGYQPFTRGHYVEAGGVSGTVERVGLFNTQLITPDNRSVTVPNGQITTSPITNYTAFETRRCDLLIRINYGDDLSVARDTIWKVITSHEKVLKDPEPAILVMDLADSSVNLAVRPWVNAADYWVVRSELLEQIKVDLAAAGCPIPFPQQTVHHVNATSATVE